MSSIASDTPWEVCKWWAVESLLEAAFLMPAVNKTSHCRLEDVHAWQERNTSHWNCTWWSLAALTNLQFVYFGKKMCWVQIGWQFVLESLLMCVHSNEEKTHKPSRLLSCTRKTLTAWFIGLWLLHSDAQQTSFPMLTFLLTFSHVYTIYYPFKIHFCLKVCVFERSVLCSPNVAYIWFIIQEKCELLQSEKKKILCEYIVKCYLFLWCAAEFSASLLQCHTILQKSF